MPTRLIDFKPGTPEWEVFLQLQTTGENLKQTLLAAGWYTDFGYYIGMGASFIHHLITTTSLFDRQALDGLLLRCIGGAATLHALCHHTTEPKEDHDAILATPLLMKLINDLHGLRCQLPELHIQQQINEFAHTTKETTQ